VPAEFAGARVWVRAGMGESGDTYIENPLSPSKMATDDEERCVMTDNSKIALPRAELVCCPLPTVGAIGPWLTRALRARVPMTPKEKLYELFDDPMSSCAVS